MRAFINIVWLSLFLLGGGQHLHAANVPVTFTNFSSFDFLKKEQIKHKRVEPGSLLIEEFGADFDEEFHRGDDVNNGADKFITVRHSLLPNWYLSYSDQFLLKKSTRQLVIFSPPNCGYFNPIYLRIGVLRI